MKRISLLVVLASIAIGSLSGCSAIALAHDRADPCQAGTTEARRKELGRPEGYQRPSYCGAGSSYRKPIYVYDNKGATIATVK